jgi:hypothetical protein
MIDVRLKRGQYRLDAFEDGTAHFANIGPIVGAVVGGFASAGASSLFDSLFGGGDSSGPSKEQKMVMEALFRMGYDMYGKGHDMYRWASSQWSDLDEMTRDAISRIEPIAARSMRIASELEGVPGQMRDIGDRMREYGEEFAGYGSEAIGRHKEKFQPLEDQWIKDYEGFVSGERQAQEMGRAGVGVKAAFDATRENALRELEGYGIDPGQARYGALDLNVRMAEAAQQALAQTEAARYVEETGRQMREDILEYGKNYPEWANMYARTGLGALEAGGRMQGAAVDAGQGISEIGQNEAQLRALMPELLRRSSLTGAQLYGSALPWYGATADMWSSAMGGGGGGGGGSSGRFDALGKGIGDQVGDWIGGLFK